MTQLLVIGFGGAFGAVARYGLSGLVQERSGSSFPAGTLAVNLLGCLLVGAVMALVERQLLAPSTRAFLVVGVLGGFTTFSAFGHETIELLRGGEARLALLSVVANVVLGLGAVLLGRALALLVWA